MPALQGPHDDGITGGRAALRRVATLVARAAPPEQVFAAVTEEAGRLLEAHQATMSRYVPGGTIVVAAWGKAGAAFPVGSRWSLGGRNPPTLVFQTGRPARTDDYADVSDRITEAARRHGLRSLVGVPISVEGRLWGVMLVGSMREEPLPAGTEVRLAAFTELAATAIANAQARVDLRGFADEQAALRRVATLVARGTPPGEVFAAVAAEVGRLLGVDFTFLSRYGAARAATIAGAWARTGTAGALSAGSRWGIGARDLHTMVFQTHRPMRINDYTGTLGPIAEAARGVGLRSAVAVPISVEGHLWGVMIVGSMREEPLPAGTEARLAGFTELAATAIGNTQARVELRGFADEQAALRRVATLVARASLPEEVFAAVTEEAGRRLGVNYSVMARYDPDLTRTIVAAWSRTGPTFGVGNRMTLGGLNVPTLVFQTGRAARIDDYADGSGPIAEGACEIGLRAAVGVPVSVEGRLWGVMIAGSRAEPLPAGIEARLAGFTELAATAIANAQARVELRGFAEDQAALRRVATLVARTAPPEEVFAAVTEEAGRLLHADYATMNTYGPDGTSRVVAGWDSTGAVFPVGTQAMLGGQNVSTLVFQTGRAARIDDYAGASGPVADTAREFGFGAAVGVPVTVEGRMWGVMVVASREEPLPAGTEARLAGFTELAATAIANAEAQAALTASRARIVATADQTRRRIERDLHDGAQQRLVSLVLQLREARTRVPSGAGELAQQLEHAVADVTGVLEELRETARGLHPATLAEGGLRPALAALARRSAVPVRLDVQVAGRLPEQAEIAGYYVAAEALTNTAKHAHATTVDVQVTASEDLLRVRVSDDGLGGADFARGSGLIGLRDRTEALGGEIWLHSPPGAGTVLEITLPLGPAGPRPPPPTSD